MSEREIALFTLSKGLVDLLGEEKALADLELLYNRHPEMFRDKEEVMEVIDKVISEPEIIIENPNKRNEHHNIIAKQLDENKMGDVGIRNDGENNVIFHANKKKLSELHRLQDKLSKKQVVGAPISYTQAQSLDGLVQKNISSATSESIAENSLPQEELQRRLEVNLKNYEKSNLTNPDFLKRANELQALAKAQNISLDSQSLHKLEVFNKNFERHKDKKR